MAYRARVRTASRTLPSSASLYPFGHGLTYGDVEEKWLSDTEVEVTNRGGMDTDYAVLRFKTEPHPELLDFKKVHVAVGETVRVEF